MADARMIYTTWPNPESAAEAGRTLVEERLAACVNVLPGAFTFSWWEGQVNAEPEVVMFVKTTVARTRKLRERLIELHPYELPAIVAIEIDKGGSHPSYLDWISQEAKG